MTQADSLQERIFAFLMNPQTHGGASVTRVDTHAASVFLAEKHAYKIKKAIRYPYLDYSDLAKRKTACFEELVVNRVFAPDLYLDVIPITRMNDRIALGGDGEAIEWAVVMRRFDEHSTLDQLASRKEISTSLADALGRMVARIHSAAPLFAANVWIERLAGFIHDNDLELRETDLFRREELEFLRDHSMMQLDHVRALLMERGSRGFVRKAHGDLHLGNVALINGDPVAFDAIEFDPLIAAGDILYDLAFLLMDLIERGLPEAANIVLNRYLIEMDDNRHLDGLATFPLFLSLRSAIRAKVVAAKLRQQTSNAKSQIRAQAKKYFDYALHFIAPARPQLIAIGGPSGTGKSILAKSLAHYILPPPGAVVLRSDIERKRMFGVAETTPLPSSAYTAEVSASVYDRLCDKTLRTIAAGHSAIVDAVFGEESERNLIETVAKKTNTNFHGLFLVADFQVRLDRLSRRVNDASDANAAIARRQEKYASAPTRWASIDATGELENTHNQALSIARA